MTLPLFAHHDGSHPMQTGLFSPYTGVVKPLSYLTFSEDWQKGAKGNKDMFITNVIGEYRFANSSFAVNINLPYLYYKQKERNDASRYGKVHLGLKYQPFFKESGYFALLEGRIGFPSGSNSDQFTGGDYYTGTVLLTLGKFFLTNFSFFLRVGGIIPLTKLHQENQANDDGINYFLRTKTVTNSQEPFELKKVTVFSGYLNYYYRFFSFSLGYLYQTPFEGVEKINATGDKIPLIFREGSAGVSALFSQKYDVSLSYRRPFYRGSDFRPYESGYTVAFSLIFF